MTFPWFSSLKFCCSPWYRLPWPIQLSKHRKWNCSISFPVATLFLQGQHRKDINIWEVCRTLSSGKVKWSRGKGSLFLTQCTCRYIILSLLLVICTKESPASFSQLQIITGYRNCMRTQIASDATISPSLLLHWPVRNQSGISLPNNTAKTCFKSYNSTPPEKFPLLSARITYMFVSCYSP